MKKKRLVMNQLMLSLLLTVAGLAISNYVSAQWTPTPAANVNVNPVYIHSYSGRPFIYIGHGNWPNNASNMGLGPGTLASTINGNNYNITAVGDSALTKLTIGANNTAIGARSLFSNLTGTGNTGLGSGSLEFNVSGIANVALGASAMGSGVSGSNNVAAGFQALRFSSGSFNVAVGDQAMIKFASGNYNCAFGVNALGRAALPSPTGQYNCAFGASSLYNLTSGSYNVGIGYNAAVADAAGSNQLSIQNVIYGINMGTYGNGNVSIGDYPAAAAAGVLPAGVYARLRVKGINTGTPSTSTPSLQLDYVPVSATPNATGRYLFRDAAGIICEATVPAGGVVTNIYTDNGTLNPATTISGNRVVNMNGQNIWFKSANSTAANGKIYIGWNSIAAPPMMPGAYRLYVEGGILTEKIKVAVRTSTTNWADYVFADNYKLMPIKNVETFIKANKHLPGIESAEDLVKNGLDLGEMQAKQMGKIEELTLYIIEQSKQIEILKTQVKALLDKK